MVLLLLMIELPKFEFIDDNNSFFFHEHKKYWSSSCINYVDFDLGDTFESIFK